jgi:hypothetical protein
VAFIVISIIIFWLSVVVIVGRLYPAWVHASLVVGQTQYELENRLNYYRIAEIERSVWGQTFHNPDCHDRCACDTCTKRYGIPLLPYTNKELVRPPTFERGKEPPPGEWHDWEA